MPSKPALPAEDAARVIGHRSQPANGRTVYTKRFALFGDGKLREYGCQAAADAAQKRDGGHIEWQEYRPDAEGRYKWFTIAGGPADLFGHDAPAKRYGSTTNRRAR